MDHNLIAIQGMAPGTKVFCFDARFQNPKLAPVVEEGKTYTIKDVHLGTGLICLEELEHHEACKKGKNGCMLPERFDVVDGKPKNYTFYLTAKIDIDASDGLAAKEKFDDLRTWSGDIPVPGINFQTWELSSLSKRSAPT